MIDRGVAFAKAQKEEFISNLADKSTKSGRSNARENIEQAVVDTAKQQQDADPIVEAITAES